MTRKSKPPIAIYSALADATRCHIVEILLAGPIPVHTLADAFSISRPAISRHLRVLKTAGLVAEVKKGRENLYTLRAARLSGAIAWLTTIASPAEAGAGIAEAPEAQPVAVPRLRRTRSAPVAAHNADDAPPRLVQPVAAKPESAMPEPARKAAPASQMGFDF